MGEHLELLGSQIFIGTGDGSFQKLGKVVDGIDLTTLEPSEELCKTKWHTEKSFGWSVDIKASKDAISALFAFPYIDYWRFNGRGNKTFYSSCWKNLYKYVDG